MFLKLNPEMTVGELAHLFPFHRIKWVRYGR